VDIGSPFGAVGSDWTRKNSCQENDMKAIGLIETKGYVGISGVYNLTAEDHNGLDVDSMVMVEVKNGTFVPAE
jgi:hypothetical protein